MDERTEDDWMHAWVEDSAWNGAGGPLNLAELIRTFLAWADG
jgi:hypothetical protein